MARLRHLAHCITVIALSFLLGVSCKSTLVELNEDNWDLMLEGEWMVEL